MAEDKKQPHKRNYRVIFFIFLFIFVAAISSFFLWRVWYFSRLIQTGSLISLPSFSKEMSTSFKQDSLSKTSSSAQMNVFSEIAPFMGDRNAPLTIIEFADFACSYSQQVSFLIRSLAFEYPDKIQFVYRNFVQEDFYENSEEAAEAASCAHDQGKFWEFHDKIYSQPSDLSRERFIQYALSLNLNIKQFIACFDNHVHLQEIREDYQAGLAAGVYGTPTFFFNGIAIPGAIPADVFRDLIEYFLSNSTP
ncbi:hypothetical protein CO172_03515 [Candidatus Uhrbacteria bacterium CG_4_9_14_3_um_filter_36_7]|uniref:Thioredoxin domain-containing protein n=1 Tax=Candidatus Uhrbacteria bacterium CG_4_9_14_3_um_filter_36_7 TaxID=1975033 RepID=A0A2M7XFZ2_9BACT|nr:MAG: hypothetical protein CO172_03515 [Candidatus Uhrbacteria bacterium CG_4_9_14_3_um_filter_36_7]